MQITHRPPSRSLLPAALAVLASFLAILAVLCVVIDASTAPAAITVTASAAALLLALGGAVLVFGHFQRFRFTHAPRTVALGAACSLALSLGPAPLAGEYPYGHGWRYRIAYSGTVCMAESPFWTLAVPRNMGEGVPRARIRSKADRSMVPVKVSGTNTHFLLRDANLNLNRVAESKSIRGWFHRPQGIEDGPKGQIPWTLGSNSDDTASPGIVEFEGANRLGVKYRFEVRFNSPHTGEYGGVGYIVLGATQPHDERGVDFVGLAPIVRAHIGTNAGSRWSKVQLWWWASPWGERDRTAQNQGSQLREMGIEIPFEGIKEKAWPELEYCMVHGSFRRKSLTRHTAAGLLRLLPPDRSSSFVY